ncbi:hypothetical protein DFH06DRAFT_1485109 [Mycena polygramma]|nr:hypothetical protein DFH06DRAFT_1485109 [Mycena polygramma]
MSLHNENTAALPESGSASNSSESVSFKQRAAPRAVNVSAKQLLAHLNGEDSSSQFLRELLHDIGLAAWYPKLERIGMTEAHLRTLSRFKEPRRDALLAKVLPTMSVMERALLSDAIQHIVQH